MGSKRVHDRNPPLDDDDFVSSISQPNQFLKRKAEAGKLSQLGSEFFLNVLNFFYEREKERKEGGEGEGTFWESFGRFFFKLIKIDTQIKLILAGREAQDHYQYRIPVMRIILEILIPRSPLKDADQPHLAQPAQSSGN